MLDIHCNVTAPHSLNVSIFIEAMKAYNGVKVNFVLPMKRRSMILRFGASALEGGIRRR